MMRIIDVCEVTKPIASPIRNAYIDFSKMTASLVAVVTDVVKDGRRVVGYGFNSNGRYGQGGLIRERFKDRILEASPDGLMNDAGTNLDPHKIWATMMQNEKPGGHGERSVAVGTIDMDVFLRLTSDCSTETPSADRTNEDATCAVKSADCIKCVTVSVMSQFWPLKLADFAIDSASALSCFNSSWTLDLSTPDSFAATNFALNSVSTSMIDEVAAYAVSVFAAPIWIASPIAEMALTSDRIVVLIDQ